MFLANKKMDNVVKTYITYNRGRDWRLLQAPTADLRGNSIRCELVRTHKNTHTQMHARTKHTWIHTHTRHNTVGLVNGALSEVD